MLCKVEDVNSEEAFSRDICRFGVSESLGTFLPQPCGVQSSFVRDGDTFINCASHQHDVYSIRRYSVTIICCQLIKSFFRFEQ